MNSLFLPALITAASIGLGCGSCCSPIVSTFLSTYVISHADGVKRGLKAFISFFTGKVVSVTILCLISSLISRQFLTEDGYIGSFNLRLFSQVALSFIGLIMILRWFKELKEKKCHGCSGCRKKETKTLPIFLAGVSYGITPCAPLLLMLGYCFTLPALQAAVTGIVFSVSSIISPLLLLAVLSGTFSKMIKREIPGAIKWFRLASYLLLIILPFTIIE